MVAAMQLAVTVLLSALAICTSDPELNATSFDKCLPLETDVCPWCVLLYRVAGEKQEAEFPFCMGALIGSRTVVTANTCLLSEKSMLYAQVPNSANPERNYTVIRRQFHPSYNYGSHAYDFGILAIDGDVSFTTGKSRGACLDFEPDSFVGECIGYGVDYKGKLTSSTLEVREGVCHKTKGDSVEGACGTNQRSCSVTAGGPVLCKKDNQGLLLGGIARNTCNNYNQVFIGGISHTREWFEKELELMNIPKDAYIHQ